MKGSQYPYVERFKIFCGHTHLTGTLPRTQSSCQRVVFLIHNISYICTQILLNTCLFNVLLYPRLLPNCPFRRLDVIVLINVFVCLTSVQIWLAYNARRMFPFVNCLNSILQIERSLRGSKLRPYKHKVLY